MRGNPADPVPDPMMINNFMDFLSLGKQYQVSYNNLQETSRFLYGKEKPLIKSPGFVPEAVYCVCVFWGRFVLREIKILSPSAILGYGFPLASFKQGMDLMPDVIAIDAGSTDPGPYYLGAGISFTDRSAVKRDLEIILEEARRHDIPVLIGSAGGSGALPHLNWCEEIIEEIAADKTLHFKMAVITADIDKDTVCHALEEGRITPLGPIAPAGKEDIADSTYIVGQMGITTLVKALSAGADVVLAGRCYDPAVFAALPALMGFDLGPAIHLGKILECAAIAAVPGSGSDCMFGRLYQDHFIVEPLSPERRCTVTSVAAHTLYEKSDPVVLPGPDGSLDLKDTKFEQIDDRRVRVSGSRFIKTPEPTVKLEGAKRVGFRTVSIAGARDPVFIENLEQILDGVKKRVADNFSALPDKKYRLMFNIYGRNGVMGSREPNSRIGHEIGIVIEAVASSQDMANTICGFARSTLLHYGFPGRLCTAGNLAFPYSPSDFKGGAVYEFTLNHLMHHEDPNKLFPIVRWKDF